MKIEICIDSVESALAAERGGADRVELCDNLIEGGTTPSAGSIKITRDRINIGLQVIIRPRGGDFLYSPDEQAVIQEDIRMAKDLGADGVVIGCLVATGDIDREQAARLIELARPMNVTFHRAFDMCCDPQQALEVLVDLGVDRILTSGQEDGCMEGLELIGTLREQAGDRIIIMPGGGITTRNVHRVVQATGVSEVHLSARRSIASGMDHRNLNCFMGGVLRPPEYGRKVTDESAVKAVVEAVA